MNALSFNLGIKVDFDMALLVIASGLYRILARKCGYADAHADRMFRDLIDMPATVTVATDQVTVRVHRRAQLPISVSARRTAPLGPDLDRNSKPVTRLA